MRFHVLGPLDVRDGAGAEVRIGGARRRALLARLLVDANRAIPAAQLIDDLWEGDPPPGAAATLQSHISQLRRALGADHVRTSGGGYELVVADGELDTERFEAELATARAQAASLDWPAAAASLEAALARWRGSALADAAGAGWAQAEAARLEALRQQAVEALLEARLESGDHAGVAVDAERAVAEAPLRERLWALLIVALYRAGRQADALRAYQRLRSTLGEDLGIDPSPDLQALEQRVLAQDATLLGEGARAGAADAVNAEPATAVAEPLPSGVVTFLLTDVVGSTVMWERAPAAMPDALAAHDRIIGAAVAGHGGTVLKSRGEGDSTFCVFRRATDAVAAALDAQIALDVEAWPDDCALAVRMAVHTGEAIERDGDYYGRTVNRVARLRATAGPGEVLLTRATADLVADHLPDGAVLEEVGVRALVGLDRPETVYRAHRGAPAGNRLSPADDRGLRRKSVTVVWVDVRTASGVLDEVDPARRREIFDRCHRLLADIASADGGSVLAAAGDALRVVFGVPDSREDDADRALAAATAMAAAMAAEAARAGGELTGLTAGIGVHTGDVVVTADGSEVAGEPLAMASRLSLMGGSGEVLVSESTWRLTRGTHGFDDEAMPSVHGPSGPVSVHRLTGDRPPDPAPSAPFVGRDPEVAQLVAAFATVVQRNQPRRATVIGSPGVGKSRLLAEVLETLAERATVASARCERAGGPALAPAAQLIEAVRARAGEVTGTDEERSRVEGALAALLAGEPGTPEETFWAVRRTVEAASRNRPLILAIDDLHWAEPMLHDLLDHLIEWIDDRPILLLAAARPELRESRPALVEQGGRVAAAVALEGLDRASTGELTRSLLGADAAEAPAMLLERVAAASAGNPLFIRELLRMLVDDGVVEHAGHEWVVTADDRLEEIPPTIHSLLAARIDRLADDEQIVLERASVLGTEVYAGALAELVPDPLRGRLDALVESLRRKELLEPAGAYWLDERVLRFHHILVRDAAYRRLVREARADLHQRVAGWLVAKTGGGADHDEVIGYHLEQAQANRRVLGPLDSHGERIAADAGARLGSAARRALERDDLAAAAALAGRALDCLDTHDPAAGELLLVRCEALLGAGDVVAAAPSVAALVEHAAGDPRLGAWATCFAVQRAALADPSGAAEAEDRVTAAAAELTALGDDAGAAKAHRVHASVLARLGRVGDCEAALDRALGAARAAGDRRQVTGVLSVAPLAALWGPSPVARAGGRCLDVIRLIRITTGSPSVEAASIRCQAVLEAYRGRVEAARTMLASARRTTEELGLRQGLLEVELFAGMIELIGGDAAAAETRLAAAQAGFAALGDGVDAAQAAAVRARALLALGRDDDALAATVDSERLGGEDLKAAIAWRSARAEVLARRGELDEADALATAAVAMAERTDALVDHADACAALAAVRRAAGDRAGAAAATERARALYVQKGATALAAVLADGEPGPDEPPAPDAGAGVPALSNAASRHYEAAAALAAAGRTDESASGADPALGNLATRRLARFLDTLRAGDWAGMAALLSPANVFDDRRAGLSLRVEGRDAVVAVNRTMYDVFAEAGGRLVFHCLAVRGDRLALVRLPMQGNLYENPLLMVVGVDADGLGDVGVFFDEGDLAAAIEELDERHAAQLAGGAGSPMENLATRALDRTFAAMAAGRFDEIEAWTSPDYERVDRRSGLTVAHTGGDVFVDEMRVVADVGVDRVERDVLAVRGERLALTRARFAGGHFEVVLLAVIGTDAEGRNLLGVLFEPRDVVEAVAEVDARYAAGEGAGFPSTAVLAASNAAYSAKDWQRLRALLAEDLVVRDHRPASFPETRGADDFLAGLAREAELVPDNVIYAARYDRVAPLVALAELGGSGIGPGGGPVETARAVVVALRDAGGPIASMDMFGADQLEAAREVFAERAGASAHAIGRHTIEFWEALARYQWDGVRALLADEYVEDDRRRGLGNLVIGVEAAIAEYRTLPRGGHLDGGPSERYLDVEVLAVRGDRLALTRVLYRSSGGAEIEVLDVVGEDVDGRRRFAVSFDAADLDAATAELDRRAREPEDNAASRADDESRRALLAGDWPAMERLWHPDFVLDDHRAGVRHRVDSRAAAIEWMRITSDVGVDTVASRTVAVRGDRLCLRRFALATGGSEIEGYAVCEVDESGLARRLDIYDLADFPVAYGELERRAAGLGSGAARNLAVRHYERVVAAFESGDVDGLAPFLNPDATTEERRRGLQNTIAGAGAVLADMRTIAGFGPASIEHEVLATRGERLALLRGAHCGNGLRVEFLMVFEVDEEGNGAFAVNLDPDDLDAAYAELDERDARLRGEAARAGDNLALRSERERGAAVVAGDWDRVRRLAVPEVVLDDHRRGVQHRAEGIDAVIEWFQEVRAAGLDDIDYHPIASDGDRLALFEVVVTGRGFEIASPVLVEVDGRGLALRIDNFDAADLEVARAELRRRSATLAVHEGDNAATRQIRRLPGALASGDIEGLRPFLAADAGIDDRRAGFRHLSAGADAVIAELEAIRDLGGRRVDLDVLAVRGERLALVRVHVVGSGFVVEILSIMEVDDEGRGGVVVVFDTTDLAEALLELDNRFAAGEAAAHARIVRAGAALMHARNREDWEAVRALHAATVMGDDLLARTRVMADLAPGYHHCIRRYVALGFDRAVGEFAPFVVGPGAGGYDSPRWLVGHIDAAGRFDDFEAYDLDDLDAALDRYRQLGPGGDAATLQARNWLRSREAYLARDFERMEALWAEDCVADDRRSGMGYVTEGRDALLRQIRSMLDVGATSLDAHVLAVRGERLALHRMVFGGSQFEVEALFVSECGADGRIVATVTFDAGDLDGALAELEHRFLTGEGAAHAAWLSLTMPGIVLAHARRDWDTVGAMYDDGAVLVDHRPAAAGEIRGADDVVDHHRAMVGVASSHREMVRQHLAIGDRVTLGVLVTGGSDDDASYENVSLLVTAHRTDGRVRRLELFPLDAEEAARARFAELDEAAGSGSGADQASPLAG